MTASLAQVAAWRKAHPALEIPEAGLVTAGPFPSLHVNDFFAYLDAQGADPKIATFVRDLGRELAWVYGNWKKAETGEAGALIADLINNASPIGETAQQYDFVRRFLRDYAAANGIKVPGGGSAEPDTPWLEIVPPGTVEQVAA